MFSFVWHKFLLHFISLSILYFLKSLQNQFNTLYYLLLSLCIIRILRTKTTVVWRIHGRHLAQLAELKKRLHLLPDGLLYFAWNCRWIKERNRTGTGKITEVYRWEAWILTGKGTEPVSIHPGQVLQPQTRNCPKVFAKTAVQSEGPKCVGKPWSPEWTIWWSRFSIHPVFILSQR